MVCGRFWTGCEYCLGESTEHSTFLLGPGEGERERERWWAGAGEGFEFERSGAVNGYEYTNVVFVERY